MPTSTLSATSALITHSTPLNSHTYIVSPSTCYSTVLIAVVAVVVSSPPHSVFLLNIFIFTHPIGYATGDECTVHVQHENRFAIAFRRKIP